MNNLKKILNLYSLFYRFAPGRNTGIFLINMLTGLSQGISIVTLIPLLQMLEKNSLGDNKIIVLLNKLVSWMGITISIELIIGLYLVLILFNALISYAKSIWQGDVQQEFTADIRKDIFSKLIRSDWIYLSGQNRNEFSHILTSEIPGITALNFLLLSLFSTFLAMNFETFWIREGRNSGQNEKTRQASDRHNACRYCRAADCRGS